MKKNNDLSALTIEELLEITNLVVEEHTIEVISDDSNTVKIFDCTYNKDTLPPGISKMKNVNYLVIKGNKLKKLPDWIVGLQHITYLRIESEILELSGSAYKWMRDLCMNYDEDDVGGYFRKKIFPEYSL